MANLEKAKGAVTNKALADIAAEHRQNTALSLTNGNTQTITLSRNASGASGRPMYVSVQSDLDIYFAWAPNTTDIISTANSLWLPGGGAPIDLRVRWGAAIDSTPDTVVLQIQRKVAATTTVRYVVG